jgi:hypothetical protein
VHADDAEVVVADLDDLVERIDRSKQLVGDVPADDRHRSHGVDLDRADQPPLLDVERREVDVVGRHALHLRAVDRLPAEDDRRA